MEKGLTKVITAELHKDLFLGGKNHGQRLDSSRFSDLVMFANEKQDRLYVTWKGFTKKLPMTNVADYTDEDCLVLDKKVDQSAAPQLAHISTSAQVETPMSHVHAGHGHGKTGVGGKIK